MTAARCCVLIPYLNAGEQLARSLDSVDGLLGGDVDVLVVDDGSKELSARAALQDTPWAERVSILELPKNLGIAEALNAGMRRLLPAYEFIARLDCGDICVADRLSTQMGYLDSHPNCAMVGTWTSFHTPAGTYLYTVRHPLTHKRILRRMHINNAFTHPSVMFRTNVVERVGFYPCDREAAEDHAYFFRIAKQFETANLGRVHVHSLIDPRGISNLKRRRQLQTRLKVLADNFDSSPGAYYGLVRATAQLLTPRQSTVWIRSSLRRVAYSLRIEKYR